MIPRILTALPVFNEQAHLVDVLKEVRLYADDILVVDDGSSDGTAQLLAGMEDIHVVTHVVNQGYGAALRSAFNFAIQNHYDVLVTIDCDGQHQPRLIPAMAAAVYANQQQPADIVSGSRYLEIFDQNSVPPIERRFVNVEITQRLKECLGLELTDSFCGFKAYRVEALKKLDVTELGYAMPLQLWVQAVRHQFNIIEFPVPLVYLDEERSFGGSLDDAKIRKQYYLQVLQREMELQQVPCGYGR